jgi:hypothetical protein
MGLPTVGIGELQVSKLLVGANPISGFSHQGLARDDQMRRWYTTARIKELLRQAEALGINTHLSRADHHVMRYLMEYWDEGGKLQWFAQTCPELGPVERGIANAIAGKAAACYIHGGVMDNLLANNDLGQVPAAIERIRKAGLTAGIAGHNPKTFQWAEEVKLPVDFYMCSYYNPIPREKSGEHVAGTEELYRAEDRDAMVATIRHLSKPAIHYKVFAAGRTEPKEALSFVAQHLRPQDAVCVGIFTQDKPDMLAEDIRLLMDALKQQRI